MARQIQITAVVEDDWEPGELEREINDVLVNKYNTCIYVEDVKVVQENYDWKKALGLEEEEGDA